MLFKTIDRCASLHGKSSKKYFGLTTRLVILLDLFASLPFPFPWSLPPLADRYEVGKVITSEIVALGRALVLPTTHIWNLALDVVDTVPIN